MASLKEGIVQQWKLVLPISRCYIHISSRKQGQDKLPQQGAYFGGSSFIFQEVSFLTLSLVPTETRASIFGGFPSQYLESDLAKRLASRRRIFMYKQNSKTPSLENQGFYEKPQVSHLQNQVKHLKSVRYKAFLFLFDFLI